MEAGTWLERKSQKVKTRTFECGFEEIEIDIFLLDFRHSQPVLC